MKKQTKLLLLYKIKQKTKLIINTKTTVILHLFNSYVVFCLDEISSGKRIYLIKELIEVLVKLSRAENDVFLLRKQSKKS